MACTRGQDRAEWSLGALSEPGAHAQYVFWYGIVEFDPATDTGRMLFANQTRGPVTDCR